MATSEARARALQMMEAEDARSADTWRDTYLDMRKDRDRLQKELSEWKTQFNRLSVTVAGVIDLKEARIQYQDELLRARQLQIEELQTRLEQATAEQRSDWPRRIRQRGAEPDTLQSLAAQVGQGPRDAQMTQAAEEDDEFEFE